MRLVLTKASFWPVHRLEDGPADATHDPSILVGPLELVAGPRGRWVERAIAVERPAFTTAEIVRTSPIHSRLLWNVEMIESRISAGMRLVERRLTYLYFIFEWCAPVVFRASPEVFEAEVDRAVSILASARPEWFGVVALADLRK